MDGSINSYNIHLNVSCLCFSTFHTDYHPVCERGYLLHSVTESWSPSPNPEPESITERIGRSPRNLSGDGVITVLTPLLANCSSRPGGSVDADQPISGKARWSFSFGRCCNRTIQGFASRKGHGQVTFKAERAALIPDIDMAASMQRLEEYRTYNQQFCQRVLDFLKMMILYQVCCHNRDLATFRLTLPL